MSSALADLTLTTISTLAGSSTRGVALLLILGACSLPPPDPRYGPNAPHNALGQAVDPVYGTRLPGLSKCCGGP